MSSTYGTENKIEQTILNYADMIYRIAFQNLKNKSDAEDIFQDVCIALITKKPPLDNEAHLKNWLIRVTINKCKNFHKLAWRKRTEPLDEHTDMFTPEHNDIMEEIFKLPKNYRTAIYLHYYESCTIAEIAEIMDKNPNTVSSWLTRARKQLKNILSECD